MLLREKIIGYCIIQRWTIGFTEQSLQEIIEGKPLKINYIKHCYKDRWFADPFILDYDDEYIHVLVEEYLDSTKLGRISKLRIDRNTYQLLAITPILELDTHLSFPAIVRRDGKIYIYPENAAGKGLAMYEYDAETDRCLLVDIVTKEPLADAIITDLFGEKLMFSTHIPTHNGSVLTVHRFEDNKPIFDQEINFLSNIARNAGDWFKYEDIIYRPAQDCNGGVYGGAVILQEVEKRSEGFVIKDVRRIESNHNDYKTGCHTFNHYKGLSVLDVHGYRHIFAARLFETIYRLKNKLK